MEGTVARLHGVCDGLGWAYLCTTGATPYTLEDKEGRLNASETIRVMGWSGRTPYTLEDKEGRLNASETIRVMGWSGHDPLHTRGQGGSPERKWHGVCDGLEWAYPHTLEDKAGHLNAPPTMSMMGWSGRTPYTLEGKTGRLNAPPGMSMMGWSGCTPHTLEGKTGRLNAPPTMSMMGWSGCTPHTLEDKAGHLNASETGSMMGWSGRTCVQLTQPPHTRGQGGSPERAADHLRDGLEWAYLYEKKI